MIKKLGFLLTSIFLLVNISYSQSDTVKVDVCNLTDGYVHINKYPNVLIHYSSANQEFLVVRFDNERIGEVRFKADIKFIRKINYILYDSGIYMELYTKERGQVFYVEQVFAYNKLPVVNK
jgi:hypothetical protein